jgi:hypothetical protein
MQAWLSLPLAKAGFGLGRVLPHETKNGAATPATVAVRRNWRRDHAVDA